MRAIDEAECCAFGQTGKEALRMGLRSSVLAFTALKDGRASAMFGVAPISVLEGSGRAWFLATDEAMNCARDLLTLGPAVIDAMHRRFRRLENWVSTDNRRAIRLLDRWGFQFGDDTMTAKGVEFRPFWKEA